MSEATLDIIGIGNAIVDVQARADDAFLSERGLDKGAMRLIGAEEAEALYAAMGPGIESSGGSAANTCAVAAALGARVGYLGKVAADPLGQVFAHDIRAAGVRFPTPPLANGAAPTARCLILVTPDGQRTMNTFLGAAVHFAEADVDAAEVARAGILYLEGYLFDPPAAQAAFRAAARAAHAAGRRVALTLSDPFCVHRHRNAFREFVRNAQTAPRGPAGAPGSAAPAGPLSREPRDSAKPHPSPPLRLLERPSAFDERRHPRHHRHRQRHRGRAGPRRRGLP